MIDNKKNRTRAVLPKLLEEKLFFETYSDNLQDLLVHEKGESVLILINESLEILNLFGDCENVLGITKEIVLSRSIQEICLEENFDQMVDLQKRILTPEIIYFEFTLKFADRFQNWHVKFVGKKLTQKNNEILLWATREKNEFDYLLELDKRDETINQLKMCIQGMLTGIEETQNSKSYQMSLSIEKMVRPLLKDIRNDLKSYSISDSIETIQKQIDNKLLLLDRYVQDLNSCFYKKIDNLKCSLTNTENRITQLIHSGHSIKEISDILCISINTTKAHCANIRKKIGIKNKSISLNNYFSSV